MFSHGQIMLLDSFLRMQWFSQGNWPLGRALDAAQRLRQKTPGCLF
jgi:hypothetical protein